MLASSSTMMGLLIVVWTIVMSGNFAYAFICYHRGLSVWRASLTIGIAMLAMMLLSLF